jgi:Domain of unknown function (DUF4926)
MMFNLLDTVALTHDIALAGLRCADLGAIIEVVAEDEFEVEFIAGSGRTQALLTLKPEDFRHLGDLDLLSVRSIVASAG